MKPWLISFKRFIQEIWHDKMLFFICLSPILAGVFFRFGIPLLERFFAERLHYGLHLDQYHVLFDLLLGALLPYMFCFASTMVMLTEYDERITGYLAVTPLGKRGYLLTRLGFPAFLSFFGSCALLIVFSSSRMPLYLITLIAFLSCLLCFNISLLLFALSGNRVGGLALAKLSGLVLLGLPAPFFVPNEIQFFLAPFPSLWIAKLAVERKLILLIPAVLTGIVWILPLYRKFDHKLSRC